MSYRSPSTAGVWYQSAFRRERRCLVDETTTTTTTAAMGRGRLCVAHHTARLRIRLSSTPRAAAASAAAAADAGETRSTRSASRVPPRSPDHGGPFAIARRSLSTAVPGPRRATGRRSLSRGPGAP